MRFRDDNGYAGFVAKVSKTHVTLIWDPVDKRTVSGEWTIREWLERCKVHP